ncbi:Protein N-acetyltransferase, RimJ/RimL family [Paenibacillus sp. 1_12]|uniref:GNAT family N-acetyltransferase n=1 Tax=Paenibacillus sp. 1_12 TaxID=1566278 RepID=UPI0008E4D9E6|nr:GNAT family protein [Paenibacillus sp. 1_12]SFM56065.1 Protein N-acetyltransferase, RimJ/RimL family [Paenibacillus sp. 1_12]
MIDTHLELTGTRVKLLPMDLIHIQDLFEVGKSPDIWALMPVANEVKTLDQMKEFVEEALLSKEQAGAFGLEYPFVVLDRLTNKIVGSTRFLDISEKHRSLEIGLTWYSPEVRRTKVNTECKYLMLKYCFEMLNLIRVQIKTDARNITAQKAIERIGAKKEGVLRNHRVLRDGFIRDSVFYSITKEEWPVVKDKLENLLEQT